MPDRRPALVYLPGLDGTGRLLHRQPGLHAAYDVSCVAYDHHTPATYEQLAALAVPHLERAGGGIVLAESFGGAVALTLALARPDLVRRLVLVNTFARYPRRLLIALGALLSRLLPAHPSPPGARGARGYFFFDPSIPEAARQEWWERTADVPMSAMGWRIRLLAGVDLRPRLRHVTAPALVLAAPNDRVVPARAGRELARLLPRARLLLPRVGHAALIHPRVDIAALLADPANWPAAPQRSG
jgi:pimeloyl-ACP methyl ester carboxylesterase